MPDIEVNVFNQKLNLTYKEDEKNRILKAVEILNQNWNKYSHLQGKVSDIKIATLISLELQDSLEDIKMLKDKIKSKESDYQLLKKEIEFKNRESQEIQKNTNKLESDLNNKSQELSKFDNIIDELLDEVLEIKNDILKNE